VTANHKHCFQRVFATITVFYGQDELAGKHVQWSVGVLNSFLLYEDVESTAADEIQDLVLLHLV
jgi:hypothetical protein